MSHLNEKSPPKQSQDLAPMNTDQIQEELGDSKMNPVLANNLAALIDNRINQRISNEMKKVS